jgi:hypothetical protein
MFDKKTVIDKAELLGERLLGGVPEIASFLLTELDKIQPGIGFRDENGPERFWIELFVFYMHILDRLAFLHLGAEKKDIFSNRLIVVVMNGLVINLNKELFALDFVAEMRDTYNRRQVEYSRYKGLIPPKDEPLKDTLLWEFSKVLFELFDDENPTTLGLLSLMVSDCTVTLLREGLKADQVLR